MSDEITDGQTIISKHPSNYNLRLNIFYDGRQKVRVTEKIRVGPKTFKNGILGILCGIKVYCVDPQTCNKFLISYILCKCLYLWFKIASKRPVSEYDPIYRKLCKLIFGRLNLKANRQPIKKYVLYCLH